VFVIPIFVKMKGVYVGGNERKRECRECFLLFFLPPSICFFKRDKKGGVCVGVVMEKNYRNVDNFFCLDRVHIYTHLAISMQSQP